MSAPIEDYAMIGDLHSVALVSREGSIDWLCLPRFHSGAVFSALVGEPENGRWRLAPEGPVRSVRRAYRADTLVLETEFEAEGGVVRLVDFMPPRTHDPTVVRIVEGVRGRVNMAMELSPRFDYGSVTPWLRPRGEAMWAVGAPTRCGCGPTCAPGAKTAPSSARSPSPRENGLASH